MTDKLTFKPVTAALWDDFERLFGARGAPGYCWCMVWRQTTAEAKHTDRASRRAAMRGRIEGGIPVGLLGYLAGEPVAWCSVAPKSTFRGLGGPEPQPGEAVWSITCFFLRRDLRKAGRMAELIGAAVDHARRQGASCVEAYPVAPDSPSYRFMGFVESFEAAGFRRVGQAGSRRHVMRLDLGT